MHFTLADRPLVRTSPRTMFSGPPLTDNGKVFTGRFGPQPVEVMCPEHRDLPQGRRRAD